MAACNCGRSTAADAGSAARARRHDWVYAQPVRPRPRPPVIASTLPEPRRRTPTALPGPRSSCRTCTRAWSRRCSAARCRDPRRPGDGQAGAGRPGPAGLRLPVPGDLLRGDLCRQEGLGLRPRGGRRLGVFPRAGRRADLLHGPGRPGPGRAADADLHAPHARRGAGLHRLPRRPQLRDVPPGAARPYLQPAKPLAPPAVGSAEFDYARWFSPCWTSTACGATTTRSRRPAWTCAATRPISSTFPTKLAQPGRGPRRAGAASRSVGFPPTTARSGTSWRSRPRPGARRNSGWRKWCSTAIRIQHGKPQVAMSADERQAHSRLDRLQRALLRRRPLLAHPVRGCRQISYAPEFQKVFAETAARRCARVPQGRANGIPWRVKRITNVAHNDILLAPLAKAAGGRGACGKAVFAGTARPGLSGPAEGLETDRGLRWPHVPGPTCPAGRSILHRTVRASEAVGWHAPDRLPLLRHWTLANYSALPRAAAARLGEGPNYSPLPFGRGAELLPSPFGRGAGVRAWRGYAGKTSDFSTNRPSP